MNRSIVFVVPGALSQRTGGYIFGRRIVEGLRAVGRKVQVAELAGRFPEVDAVARAAASHALSSVTQGAAIVIDGLALPAFDTGLLTAQVRHPVLGFIHHPLALETGLSVGRAERLGAIETALWSRLDGVVCASAHTARSVLASGVAPGRLAVAEPGVDLPLWALPGARVAQGPIRLLCVATVTARKGHHMLIDALARVRSTQWRLDCIGSLERDPFTVASLRRAIDAYGLSDRVMLHGEQPDEALEQAWRDADLFVLASHHEGYGMVFTEAIARGLPIVATRAGAIPETVPAAAGRLVATGDVAGLAHALDALIGSPDERKHLADAALQARARLVPWPTAVLRWADAVDQLCARRVS